MVSPGGGCAARGLGRVCRLSVDRALLVWRVGEDGGAGLPSGAEAQKGPPMRHRSHGFPGTTGFQLWEAGCAQGFWCCAAVSHFFAHGGKGERKGVKKVIWGLSDKVFFLLGVTPELCFRPT